VLDPSSSSESRWDAMEFEAGVLTAFSEVLLFRLLAMPRTRAESFVRILRYRWFRPFRDRTPSHDQLGDIFATLDAGKFQQSFVSWVASLTGALPNAGL
jgi:hypothetical protein